MADVTTELIRNVVLLSHSGAGKTILSESLLNQTGVTNRIGTVEDGTTVSDFEAEESKRGNSVQTSIMHAPWRNHKINILDTPGYADYRGEVVSGIRVADCAVIVVSAPSGLEVGTSQMWKMADDLSLPRIVYISKMDRENADFGRALDSLTERFGRHLVPLQVPVGSEASFSGVINVLAKDADVPEELQSEVDDAMERLTEAVAEIDDELADKYLEGEEITEVEIRAGLIKGIRETTLVPVLAGSPPNSIGVTELLDVIADYMPSPADVGNVSVTTVGTDGESELACDSDGPLAALVFKTAADPFVGRLSYFRVYSGTLGSDSQGWNANKSEAERVGQVFVVNGKSQDSLDSLAAGDIGALSRLNSVVTGDTISSRENPIVIEGLNFPIPVHHMAVSPKTKADVDKMTSSLSRIVEEDPSLIVSRDEQTLEVIMQGLGDTHLDVAIEKMKRKFGVELEMSIPRVPYMETISRRARVEYRHKKQSGGHGQFGHVWLEVEPLPRGSGFEFAQSIVGGVVPREYIPAVEKGVRSALDDGVVAGFPVIDFKATLVDGSFHAVDSSGVSFEIAGGHAATKGMAQAGPVLLEPIMKVDITVPDEFTGDIIGDLNGRRGRIQGMVPNGDGTTTINCEAPRAEMLTYATDLRSQTQGQGSFTLEFDHYEDVPQHLVDQVVQSMSGEPESAQARS
ncbi:MAG TPA: elongation factor G [Dehalococcoidia bacterium]|nr:elongation factor G [Dehalococcoidia bacterium]